MKVTKETKTKGSTAVVPVQAKVLVSNKALIAKIKAYGMTIKTKALAIVLKDDAERAAAAELRAQAKKLVKDVDLKFDDARATAYKIYCLVKDGITDMKADPEKAVQALDRKMSDYDIEKERKAAIAKAEADRLAKELEDKEKAKMLKQADKIEAKGDAETAAEIRTESEQVKFFMPSAPGAEKTTRTESGTTSGSKDFTIEVINPALFIQQVVLNGGNFGFVEFKLSPIKRYAEGKKVGDVLPIIPGCKLTPKIGYRSTGSGSSW